MCGGQSAFSAGMDTVGFWRLCLDYGHENQDNLKIKQYQRVRRVRKSDIFNPITHSQIGKCLPC